MQLKSFLLNGNIARSFYRNYVSAVSINVKALKSIKVQAKDVLGPSDDEVKLTILDSQQNQIDVANAGSLNVVSTSEAFKIECNEPQEFSVIVEVPLSTSPEVELDIKAESSSVHVESLPTKHIDVSVDSGDISFRNIKSHKIRAETRTGNIATKSTLLANVIQLTAKDGVSSVLFDCPIITIRFTQRVHLNFRMFLSQKHKETS